MARKSTAKQIINLIKDADDMVELITGKRIHQFVQRGIELYGTDIKSKLKSSILGVAEDSEDSPYRVLHCRKEASDAVVRGKYRLLVLDLHPSTGTHPDEAEFRRVVEAYNAILELRRGRPQK